jgi:hypothetical protein
LRVENLNNKPAFQKPFEEFVAKHDLLFNSREWINNYNKENITQCVILNNNDEVIGCFNYYTFKKSVFKFIISPPYAPNIDLFYVNPSASVVGKNSFNKDISKLLADYFDSLNVHYVNVNLPGNFLDTQPFIWKGYVSRSRFSYLIDLSQAEEKLWENLSSEKRKSINKAAKDGLEVKASNDHETIYSLAMKSLERNALGKNNDVIRKIIFSFARPENSFVFIVYNNNVAIGASFCVIEGDKAVYLFGGFDHENKHHGAGVSCMWQSILEAKKRGLKYFDFEGSMDPKIERYFREFGGELITYFCVQKVKPLLKILLALKKHNPI